ncbi:MAG TPA: heme exporter protein CcmB [Ktedonobacterales bacterium]|nr:heme exporter protein CcmB [Ktedonobacterales bacterium]
MRTFQTGWQQLWSIVGKDLRSELRARQVWVAMALFSALVMIVFYFAFDLRVENRAPVAPGALWIAFVFASVLGLGRTFAAEQEHGAMDRLLLCPVDRQVIFLAKLIGNLIFLAVVEAIAVPLFAAIYNLPILSGGLVVIVVLGTVGIATMCTIFAAVASATRAREVILPLLVFPLLIPVVIGAVRATQSLLIPVVNDPPWPGLLAAFDVIFVTLSVLFFQFVVED